MNRQAQMANLLATLVITNDAASFVTPDLPRDYRPAWTHPTKHAAEDKQTKRRRKTANASKKINRRK